MALVPGLEHRLSSLYALIAEDEDARVSRMGLRQRRAGSTV